MTGRRDISIASLDPWSSIAVLAVPIAHGRKECRSNGESPIWRRFAGLSASPKWLRDRGLFDGPIDESSSRILDYLNNFISWRGSGLIQSPCYVRYLLLTTFPKPLSHLSSRSHRSTWGRLPATLFRLTCRLCCAPTLPPRASLSTRQHSDAQLQSNP